MAKERVGVQRGAPHAQNGAGNVAAAGQLPGVIPGSGHPQPQVVHTQEEGVEERSWSLSFLRTPSLCLFMALAHVLSEPICIVLRLGDHLWKQVVGSREDHATGTAHIIRAREEILPLHHRYFMHKVVSI